MLELPGEVYSPFDENEVEARIRSMIEPGDQAPDFEIPDQHRRSVKLSDFRGQPVVVYFYPKADTSGTKHAGH